jgi:energy-coupling factor transporter transmembrane protein EcfT
MFAYWGLALLPIFLSTDTIGDHSRFALYAILPLAFALVGVWGWLIGSPPGASPGSDPMGGVMYGLRISARLLLLTGVFQLCFLSLPEQELAYTLQRWGLGSSGIAVVIGGLSLWPEAERRAEQIMTARYARGLVPNRRFLTRVKQLPFLLRPLLVWILRSGVERAEAWKQRGIIDQIGKSDLESFKASFWANVVVVLAGFGWLFFGLWRFLTKI